MRAADPQVQSLINEVARAFDAYKAERRGAEARARALVEAEVAQAVASRLSKLGEALRVALEGGATKVALKAVTTKDRHSFEALLPVRETPEVPDETNLGYLHVEWAGEFLQITLDPAGLADVDCDPADARCWSYAFELYTRESDGKKYLDPVGTREYPVGYGVSTWLNRHPEDAQKVFDWVRDNPA